MNPMNTQATQKYDLAVCYRIYPGVSGNPIFGFNEKLPLLTLNLETFKESLGALKVKMWFLLDKCPSGYRELLKRIFPNVEMEVISLGGEGNRATFHRQVDILTAQSEAELVYFAEDDYLYLPGSLERLVNFMRTNPEADFATPYDHPDYHNKFIHRFRGREVKSHGHRWREVVSTCLTFIARKQALVDSMPVFKTYNQNPDLAIWMALTKIRVCNPWSWFRSASDGLFFSASHALAWRYAWRQLILGKRKSLWAPVPSLGTHMETNGLAPGTDWETMFRNRADPPKRSFTK
jgi:hypothetical protein